jgi:hypothetical protein
MERIFTQIRSKVVIINVNWTCSDVFLKIGAMENELCKASRAFQDNED